MNAQTIAKKLKEYFYPASNKRQNLIRYNITTDAFSFLSAVVAAGQVSVSAQHC